MTCKDCIHYVICEPNHFAYGSKLYKSKAEEKCSDFKDKSTILDLPCKVGDTVYAVNDCLEEIVSGIVEEIYYCGDNTYFHTEGYNIQEDVTEFGKTVFLTEEQAEKALEGLK